MNRGKKLLLLLMLKLLKLFFRRESNRAMFTKRGKVSEKANIQTTFILSLFALYLSKMTAVRLVKKYNFLQKNNWTDSVEINRTKYFCPKLEFGQIANTFKPKVWLNFRYEVCSLFTKYIAKPELFHSREPWYFQAKTAYLTINIKKDSYIKKTLREKSCKTKTK